MAHHFTKALDQDGNNVELVNHNRP